LPAGALRLQIVRELARLTQCTPEELAGFAELPAAEAPRGPRRMAPPRARRAAPAPLEARVLQLLLGFPQLVLRLTAEERQALLTLDSIESGAAQALLDACAGAGAQGSTASVAEALAQGPAADQFVDLVRELVAAPSSIVEVEEAEREMRGAVGALQVRAIQRELERLAAGGLADPAQAERYRQLSNEQARLRAVVAAARVVSQS